MRCASATIALALLTLAACGSPAVEGLQLATGPGYDAELARVDADLSAALTRADALPSDWKRREMVVGLIQQRARLTGDLSDYQRAEAQLALAMDAAVEGSGPLLQRAGLNYSLHRLPPVEADLAQVEQRINLPSTTAASVILLRANTHFQQGRYTEAQAGVAQSLALSDTGSGWSATGRQAWLRADFETASAAYDEVEARYHGIADEPRAWVHLQRGLMDLDRGRYEAALEHYLAADAALPGYWLVHEHIAEILVELDRTVEAEVLYRDVVERTGNPELMDALAGLLMEDRRKDEAAEWSKRAREGHLEALALYPEAAAGHALGHWLDTGDDPAFALELARANVAARDNALSHIQLAEALLLNGDAAGAWTEAQLFLATPVRTADGLVVAAEAARGAGERDRSERLCEEAKAIAANAECGG